MVSRRTTAIILSIIISGVGQMYLGRVKRGVVILVVAITMSFPLSYYFGWIGIIPSFAFWIWQAYDASKIGLELEAKKKDDFATGWEQKP